LILTTANESASLAALKTLWYNSPAESIGHKKSNNTKGKNDFFIANTPECVL
jgi:hypothetical protein